VFTFALLFGVNYDLHLITPLIAKNLTTKIVFFNIVADFF